jgi:transglutaminase-like putative cysteine protease
VSDVHLRSTEFLDAGHPHVRALAQGDAGEDAVAVARRLYLAVRDGFLYDPYSLDLTRGGCRASAVVERGRGYCVTKAVLLAAAARAAGIPSRLGFADVRNHLATERLRQLMGTDVFYWHGYAELFLRERWVKATPAFNATLCAKLGVAPLEFDGESDAVFQPFDGSGRRFMEYVNDRGSFDDLPFEELRAGMIHHYPALAGFVPSGDFEKEAESDREGAREHC